MNALKMKSLKSVLWVIIIGAVGFIAAMVFVLPSTIKMIMGPVRMEEVDYSSDDLDGTYVTGTIPLMWGYYLDDRGSDGGGMLEAREYVIYNGLDNFLGYRVEYRDFDQAEALLDASYDYYDGLVDETAVYAAAYEVKGTIHAMKGSQLDSWNTWWDEDDEEYRDMAIPYYLELNVIGSRTMDEIQTGWLGACFSLVLALFFFARAMSGHYQKSITTYIKNSANPEATKQQVETFLSSVNEVNGLRYNSQFILGRRGSKSVFGAVSDLLWAYQYTVTHKRNGITVGHTYSLMLGFVNGKKYTLDMKNESHVQEHLNAISQNFPHVVVGFSDELDKMFRKDIEQFKQLKYNGAKEQAANDPFANV